MNRNLTNIEVNDSSYYDVNETDLDKIINSNDLVEKSTQLNLIATFIVLIFGLIGNYLIIYVFIKKKNRKNSSHIFLLCLAINDCLFLKIHFFENVLRTFQSLFLSDIGFKYHTSLSSLSFFIKLINITDKFDIGCRLINYFRYVLRFISAFIIVAFTIQRLIIVSTPFGTRFKSKLCAWNTVLFTVVTSLLINSWVPFLFEIYYDEVAQYCDIKQSWKTRYLEITVSYVILTMLIPISVIFIANFMTIVKTIKSDTHRSKNLNAHRSSKPNIPSDMKTNLNSSKKNELKFFMKSNNMKSFYSNNKPKDSKGEIRVNNSKKITRMLMFISLSYAIFNMPYLVIWLIYYAKMNANPLLDSNVKNYLFSFTRISETLQILNYSLHFYIYCISGATFRNQLKNTSNYTEFIIMF